VRLVLFATNDASQVVAIWTFSQLATADPSVVFGGSSVFASEIDTLLGLKTEGAIGALFSRLIESGPSFASERVEMPAASRYRYYTHYGENEVHLQ